MRAALALAGIGSFALVLGLATAVPLATAEAGARRPNGEGVTRPAAPTYTAPPLVETALPEPGVRRGSRAPAQVGSLRLPIADAAVPSESELLPEAARDYRAGIHEGIDFPVPAGTPVLAAGDGVVVRADRTFTDWSDEGRAAALAEAVVLGRTPERTLDRIRGRQVWIDHGQGVVTRYSHLATVAAISVGDRVRTGVVVGTVGSSGYPEGGPHLHFEIRVGESYLGDGLTPAELARALRAAFR